MDGDEYVTDGQTATVTLDPNDTIYCTFTNTAVAELEIIKHVINDDGETATAGSFNIDVKNNDALLSTISGSEDGTAVLLSAGSYEVKEQFNHNYEVTYSDDCEGTITLGQKKTCTITNNDISSDSGNSSGSSGNSGGSVLGASTESTTSGSGSVLGALSCSFLSYEQLLTIRNGESADPAIVRALQEWLNSSQNAGLAVTGVYDQPTRFAIMLLQEKFASEVLAPWGLTKATGNVWQTTAALILRLVCGTQVETGPLAPFNS